MAVTVLKKCITVTREQDEKVRSIQIRRMATSKKTVSYSSVLQEAIKVGLEQLQ